MELQAQGINFRVGFCISGQGQLFRTAALFSRQLGIFPVVVIAEEKAAADLDEFCARLDIPFRRIGPVSRSEFDEQVNHACISANLDLLCLTFDKIISPTLVSHYRNQIINVHMGLLPAFKGLHAIDKALDTGVRYAGATIHLVDEELDHGSIIAQCVLGTRQNETAKEFGDRLYPYLRLMFLQVIAWFSAGRVEIDNANRAWVSRAVYGEYPISPSIEQDIMVRVQTR